MRLQIHFYALFCLLLAQPCLRGARAAEDSDWELLKLVANGWRSNTEQVSTWKGSAEIVSSRKPDADVDGAVATIFTYAASFAYDRDSGAKRWDTAIQKVVFSKNGQVTPLPDQNSLMTFAGAMLKSGDLYRYGRNIPKSHSGPRVLSIQNGQDADISHLSDDFDPQYYSTMHGVNIYEHLMTMYEHRAELLHATVAREGDIVTFTSRHPGGSEILMYDLSKGCNIVEKRVEYRGDSSNQTQLFTWEYEKAGAVFVPVRATSRMESSQPPGGLKLLEERVVSFTSNRVNLPLDDTEFTIEALGIKPGDKVDDRRTGVQYVYGGKGTDTAVISAREIDDIANSVAAAGIPAKSVPAEVPSQSEERAAAAEQGPPAWNAKTCLLFCVAGAAVLAGMVCAIKVFKRPGQKSR